jgi:uncharacterized membrane protein YedE/YeeE
MIEWLSQPWPWWVAGPAIGLIVPLLLLYGGKAFGVSSSLRHVCAAILPRAARDARRYFDYDWRREGLWNLVFVGGGVLGGFLAGTVFAPPDPVVGVSEATRADLSDLGIADQAGLAPADLFSWEALGTAKGLVALVVGGFLLGFGARWANGCTSGHAVTGLADLQVPSFVATMGFFAGGLLVTHLVLPVLL